MRVPTDGTIAGYVGWIADDLTCRRCRDGVRPNVSKWGRDGLWRVDGMASGSFECWHGNVDAAGSGFVRHGVTSGCGYPTSGNPAGRDVAAMLA